MIDHNIPINATPIFYNGVEVGQNGEAIYARMSKEVIERPMGLYTDLAYKGVSVSMGGDPPGTIVEESYPVWLFQQSMTLAQPGRPEIEPFPPMRSRFTIDKAWESMTVNAAWQMRMEDKIGSIEVGKYADFAIFNQSLREIELENLVEDGKVLATILNGEFTVDGRSLNEEEWKELTKIRSSASGHPFGCCNRNATTEKGSDPLRRLKGGKGKW